MKTKKNKFYFTKTYLPIYKTFVYFIYGDKVQYEEFLKKKYKNSVDSRSSQGMTHEFTHNKSQRKEYTLWIKNLDLPTLAHEAVHLAHFVFANCGIIITGAGAEDEHFAYFVEYIMREYLDFYNFSRKRKKIYERKNI